MGGAGQAPQAVGKLNSAEQSAESHRRRGFSDIIHSSGGGMLWLMRLDRGCLFSSDHTTAACKLP